MTVAPLQGGVTKCTDMRLPLNPTGAEMNIRIPGLSVCEIGVSQCGSSVTTTQFTTLEDTFEGQTKRGKEIRGLAESILEGTSGFVDEEGLRPEPYPPILKYPNMSKKSSKKTPLLPIDAKTILANELGCDLSDIEGEMQKARLAQERRTRADSYPAPPKRSDYDSSEAFQNAHTEYNVTRANALGVRVKPCKSCTLKGHSCKIDITSLVAGKRTFKCGLCYAKKVACSASEHARALALCDEEFLIRFDEDSPDNEKWLKLRNIIEGEKKDKEERKREREIAKMDKGADQVRGYVRMRGAC